MLISQKLPQFEKFPALFITSGEYEAHFYVAFHGQIQEAKVIKIDPRTEAKEKQGFIGHKAGLGNLSAVSHRGQYLQDLKNKFSHQVHDAIHNSLQENKQLNEIYIFAPKYVTKRIMKGLDKEEQKKVRMQFYKQYSKSSPLILLKNFQKEVETIQQTIMQTPGRTMLFR